MDLQMRIMLPFFYFILAVLPSFIFGDQVIYRIGKGTLEKRSREVILSLKGKPYERGVQHGKLLKQLIQDNIARFIDCPDLEKEKSDRLASFQENSSLCLRHIPQKYLEEMKGVAYGADVPFEKILALNLFPEMFHCLGITAQGRATRDGALYHVRVLDYSIGKGLEKSGVLMVVQPEEGKGFVSYGYAGFIGVVTGMNTEKIAVGEIGGKGYGYWEGIPMTFLLREIMETATSLSEAKHLLEHAKRTCEYYYVLSDGHHETSTGVYATASQIHFFPPGVSYAFLAPGSFPTNYKKDGNDDKCFLSHFSEVSSKYDRCIYDSKGFLVALFLNPIEDCLILKGWGHPERYSIVAQRLEKYFGHLDPLTLQEVIKEPVTNESNLHNAIFCPSTLNFWVSQACNKETPASLGPYEAYNLMELLQNRD